MKVELEPEASFEFAAGGDESTGYLSVAIGSESTCISIKMKLEEIDDLIDCLQTIRMPHDE